MENEPIKTAEELYPELNEVAEVIAGDILRHINFRSPEIKSECPYKAQCILEMVISKLERAV
jgi:hypothetical protein